MNVTSVCLSGTVLSPAVRSKASEYIDIESKVPRQAMKVKLKLTADKASAPTPGTKVIVYNAQLYKSMNKDNDTDFALNVKKGFIKTLQADENLDAATCSLIADVKTDVRFDSSKAEFVIHDSTIPEDRDINIHVIITGVDKSNFPIKKGDKIMICGGQVGKNETDKKCAFILFAERSRVHLIPFFDGDINAASL